MLPIHQAKHKRNTASTLNLQVATLRKHGQSHLRHKFKTYNSHINITKYNDTGIQYIVCHFLQACT